MEVFLIFMENLLDQLEDLLNFLELKFVFIDYFDYLQNLRIKHFLGWGFVLSCWRDTFEFILKLFNQLF